MSRAITMMSRAREYLTHRRSLGFELKTSGQILLEFARFADHAGHHGPLKTKLILRWVARSDKHSAQYRSDRLSIVRGFARHVAARDGCSEVPDARIIASGCRRRQPHIYTDKQVRDLITAAANLQPVYPWRGCTYATLFGLLASTGLRVSEALNLLKTDVDLKAGILHIRQAKFRKQRLVPMHPSVTQVIKRYAQRRDRDLAADSSVAFFVGRQGLPLPYSTVRNTFRRLCARLKWRGNGVFPRPRIHDLRHSFACRRLLRWYHEGVDVDHAIASLSTYLGHGKVSDTYWYLTGTGELLSIAGERFERFASPVRRHS